MDAIFLTNFFSKNNIASAFAFNAENLVYAQVCTFNSNLTESTQKALSV